MGYIETNGGRRNKKHRITVAGITAFNTRVQRSADGTEYRGLPPIKALGPDTLKKSGKKLLELTQERFTSGEVLLLWYFAQERLLTWPLRQSDLRSDGPVRRMKFSNRNNEDHITPRTFTNKIGVAVRKLAEKGFISLTKKPNYKSVLLEETEKLERLLAHLRNEPEVESHQALPPPSAS
jgi:hypothetical protein